MSAQTARTTRPTGTARPRCARGLSLALAGVLALMMQMIAPALASTEDGAWIEICSDFGPVMTQIDLSDGPAGEARDCPDCEDCVLCSVSVPAANSCDHILDASFPATAEEAPEARQTETLLSRYQLPVSRGPPSPTLLNGDAPWT